MKKTALKISSVGLAALSVLGVGASAAQAAETATPGAIDTARVSVVYNGRTIDSAAATGLQTAAEAAGREFVLVYDPASAAKGLAHAFASRAAADKYGTELKARNQAISFASAAQRPKTTSAATTNIAAPATT